MTADARTGPGAAAYRGFLFSDVRGFTAFAERHGNAAAAAMVGRFLELARRAIARHGGSEVGTEGDAIHAVFASASSAVMCGLDILDAATELNEQEPDRPIGLGVGVHAGEAVETAEGYIGRAVNIAARLCSAARPGELLVSSTVKGIAQASIPVGFIPRGRRRLKGIKDPVLVYSVTRDPNARAPREVPRPVVLGAAGVAVAAILAVAVIVGSRLAPTPFASAGPTPTPVARPVTIGSLPIGTYRTRAFEPPVTFEIADPGWAANRDQAEMLGLVRERAPLGSVFFLRVKEVITDPCLREGEGATTGPGPADLVTQLRGLAHLTLSDSTTVRVGGYVGQQMDVTVSDGALAACGGLVGGDVALFVAGAERWRALPGERFRLIALDAAGKAVTVLLSTDWTETPSVQELEKLNELGQRVLDSARF